MRRVVVTGLGCVTPLGNDVQTTWEKLKSGQSGIAPIESFDTSDFVTKFAGEIKGFDPTKYVEKKEVKKMDPFIHYALASGDEALADAGIEWPLEDPKGRVGVVYGAGFGGMSSIEEQHAILLNRGPKRLSPFFIPKTIINLAPGQLSMRYKARGPNLSPVSACATGNHAIGEAMHMIRRGDADVIIAGSSEAATRPLGLAGFNAMKALSTRNDEPQRASRPFDKDRDGFVMGDGGGCIVLEELEHAKKRGAKIYAELAGYALTGDAHHMTAPSPGGEGAARCMTHALEVAQIDKGEVEYINAHGTSTPGGDLAETQALKTVLGDHAKSVMVSSTKSMTGHLLGGAGGIEAVFTILALHHGVIPPTINLDNPDPECDLDYVPHEAREKRIQVALTNSFGFGGTNAVLVFKKL